MSTKLTQRVMQAIAEQAQKRALLEKASGLRKWAAQPPMGGGMPPMDPAMMGGAPPMDPAMMGGMPMDPAAMGGMPMDPAMMGGAPPMDPAMMGGMPPVAPPPPAPPAPAGDPAAAGAGPGGKKMKPDEYMSKLDNRLYNVQVMLVAIIKALNIPVPAEALIMPAAGNEPDMDNPLPQLPSIGGGNDVLATGAGGGGAPPEMGGDIPPSGGETPKTASYRYPRTAPMDPVKDFNRVKLSRLLKNHFGG